MVQEILDEIDKKILKIYQENADITYAELGRRLGISPSTVYMRVRRLREKGIIKKIVAIVDPEVLGYNLRALVFLSIDVRKYDSIVKELKALKDVRAIFDITGEWTFMLEVLVKDHKDLARLLDVIGNIDGVIQTATSVVLNAIKEDRRVLID